MASSPGSGGGVIVLDGDKAEEESPPPPPGLDQAQGGEPASPAPGRNPSDGEAGEESPQGEAAAAPAPAPGRNPSDGGGEAGEESPPGPAQGEAAAAGPAPAPGRNPSDGLRAENERLFQEFVDFCSQHTKEHPEVMPYLAGRHQKTCHQFLGSVEFRNVLGRCLTRVQAKRSKIYVYIQELCTILKANSQKRKLVPSTTTTPASAEASPALPGLSESAAEPSKPQGGSKRQIRYLENLLRVHAEEIRRLQEQELDLDELDREDSAYMQESRLKRRMMRIFERLCKLKDCNSLTGRVIEQRIPYRGTRYPEVNRRVEHLINRPDVFPDYSDILKVVQKASSRHNLGLPKCQMKSMAVDIFREVGNRLKERRHLDLVYNFGSHLTDHYQRASDPALKDSELARRLRHNQEQAAQRLEGVMSHYAQLQDKGEEEWRQKRGQSPSRAAGQQQGEPASAQASEAAGKEGSLSSTATRNDDLQTDEEEEEESSSESDMEAELEASLEEGGEEEESPALGEDSPVQEVEADQHMDPEVPEMVLYSSSDEEQEDEEEEEEEEEEGGEGMMEQEQPQSTPEQVFLLEVEATLPLEASETPPPSPPPHNWTEESDLPPSPPPVQKAPAPAKRSRTLENGSACEADQTSIQEPPPHKKGRRELRVSNSSCIEVPSGGSSEDDPCSPPPLMADSTCADSPGLCLVTSSQESPAMVCKTSVATQCDPEEIIVLSDSE